MRQSPILLRRDSQRSMRAQTRPSRMFLPGRAPAVKRRSRADTVVDRVLATTAEEAAQTLAEVYATQGRATALLLSSSHATTN